MKKIEEDDNSKIFIFAILFILIIWLSGFTSNSNSTPSDFSMKHTGRERLKSNLRDPGSLEIISEKIENGEYKAEFRAKNAFGGYSKETYNTR